MAATYATIADLIANLPRGEQELIELTDLTGSGEIDDARTQRALDQAQAELDTYVGAAYTLPLVTVPDVLRDRTCDVARYRLYGDAPLDEVRQRYEDAIGWAKLLAAGKVELGLPPEEQPAPAPATASLPRYGQAVSSINWAAY